MTLVEGLTSTVAVPVFSVTCTELPDTDAIRPKAVSAPWADAGADVAGDVAGDSEFLDELHAPADSAVALATARTANRVSRTGSNICCIEILSIVGRLGEVS
jgi:hypothetical protein